MNQEQHWCEAIYDAKAAELILYGRALGLGHGEAEDVLQETFLTLMQMEFAPAKPEHYCVRSFRNRALNYRRTLWRRLTREWEVLADGHLFGNGLHWFEKSPEQTRAENALQEATVRALAELPLDQREVIVLKIWHGCTFEEIGGLLDIPPNTAAGRYRYGLQKLKSKLAADALECAGAPQEGVVYERAGRESIAWLASAPTGGGA
ncbi:MAG: polymerase sigma factor SigW [Verrucomicrobiota bacterium]|jgi:RNA polymerase sigma-70 factor (ECF subfamily)